MEYTKEYVEQMLLNKYASKRSTVKWCIPYSISLFSAGAYTSAAFQAAFGSATQDGGDVVYFGNATVVINAATYVFNYIFRLTDANTVDNVYIQDGSDVAVQSPEYRELKTSFRQSIEGVDFSTLVFSNVVSSSFSFHFSGWKALLM